MSQCHVRIQGLLKLISIRYCIMIIMQFADSEINLHISGLTPSLETQRLLAGTLEYYRVSDIFGANVYLET